MVRDKKLRKGRRIVATLWSDECSMWWHNSISNKSEDVNRTDKEKCVVSIPVWHLNLSQKGKTMDVKHLYEKNKPAINVRIKLLSPTVLLMPSAFPTCSMVTCWIFPWDEPWPWASLTSLAASVALLTVLSVSVLELGNMGCYTEQEQSRQFCVHRQKDLCNPKQKK